MLELTKSRSNKLTPGYSAIHLPPTVHAFRAKMGTRGVIVFEIDGHLYAIYSNYNSFPDNLGQKLVDFIVSLDDDEVENMAKKVREINWHG